MNRKWLAVAVAVSMVVPACVWAQAPGGFGSGSSMRNSPKRRLTGLVRNIGELEKAKKAPLSKDQAKKVVAAIKPWQTRPKMTDDEAKGLYMKINAVFTTKQKNEMDKMAAQNRRFGGGSGRSGGRSGGWGGGSGRTPPSAAEMQKMRATFQKMQGFMKTSNPFYPPSKYKEVNQLPARFKEGMNRRYASQQALLAQLAKKAR